MMKHKLLALLISLALICPLGIQSSVAIDESQKIMMDTAVIDTVPQSIKNDVATTLTKQNKSDNSVTKDDSFKKPLSKKKIVKKFLLAMFGVTASSFLIFFILTMYNKVRLRVINQVKTPEGETPLKTPDNINEAVQIFLEKTQWK